MACRELRFSDKTVCLELLAWLTTRMRHNREIAVLPTLIDELDYMITTSYYHSNWEEI